MLKVETQGVETMEVIHLLAETKRQLYGPASSESRRDASIVVVCQNYCRPPLLTFCTTHAQFVGLNS